MTKLIDLGRASEETRGTEFNSVQLDGAGVKIEEGGVKYRSADPSFADLVRVEDPL
jgi:hypothetical protein